MNLMRRFRPLLMVVAFLAMSATSAFATHFRYGTITWSTPNPATPNVIQVRFDAAWRRDFQWPSPAGTNPQVGQTVSPANYSLWVLDSRGGMIQTHSIALTFTSVNTAENWVGTTFSRTITLPATTANYTLRFENCCRLSGFTLGNSDKSWRLDSGVTIRMPSLATNRPPTAASLPIIRVPFHAAASFVLPAFDPDGDTLTYRTQTVAEASIPGSTQVVNPVPTGLTITASGTVSWNTNQAYVVLNALYMASFRVTDPFGAFVVVDVLLQPVTSVGAPPVTTIDDVAADATFSVVRSQPLSFTVKGVDPEVSNVTMSASPLPSGATMTPGLPTSSNTGTVTSTFNWTPGVSQTGGYVIQYSVVDGNGAMSTRQVNITVTNNPPEITSCIPSGTTIEAGGFTGGPFSLEVSATDADNDPLAVKVIVDDVLQESFAPGVPPLTRQYGPATYALGSHTYSGEVSDGISAPVNCTGTFTIVDSTGPSLTNPPDQTLEATSPAGATASWDTPTASDVADPSVQVTCSPVSGSTFPVGSNTASCTATDASGNSTTVTFTIDVVDTTPPSIDPHTDVPATLSGSTTVEVSYDSPAATDIVDGPVGVTCGPASGSAFGIGTTPVTCTATDAHGNSSSSTFNVAVSDLTAPVVTSSVASTLPPVNGWYRADVDVSFSVVDAESAVTSSGCDAVSVSSDTAGVTFTCEATSAGGTGSASVTVKRDATAPDLTVSGSLTREAADGSGVSVSYAAPTAVDDTSGLNGSASCGPVSGSVFGLGTTTVHCSATDNAGNEATASFDVTVQDTTGPLIAAHDDVPATLNGATTIAVTFTNPTATDAVDGPVSVTCAPASGSTFGIGTTPINCTASDAHGNSSTSSFNVIVSDATAPVITPSVAGTLGSNGWYRSNIDVSFSVVDAESAVTSSECDAVSVSSDTAGVTFTCSASSAGGSSSASVTVKRDATAPVVSTPAPITAAAADASGAVVSFADATAADNLSGVDPIASCVPASGSLFPIGVTTVTCSAMDNAGNPASATFDVTVTDTVPPVISSATPSIRSLWPPSHQMVPLTIAVSATDNVGIAACVVSDATSNEPDNGLGDGDTANDIAVGPGLNVQLRAERSGKGGGRIYTVTVRCTDAAGNATTQATEVTVAKSQGK